MSVAMINTTTSVTSSLLLWSWCTSLQLQSSSFFISAAAGHDGIVGHFRVGAIWEPLFKPCTAYVTPWSYCGALRCDKDLFEVQGVEVLLQLNDIVMNQPLVIWYFVWDKVSEMWFDWSMYLFYKLVFESHHTLIVTIHSNMFCDVEEY